MNKLMLKLNKKQEVNLSELINIANDSNSKVRIDFEKENIVVEDIEKLAITNFVTAVEKYYDIIYVDIVNNERTLIDSNWMIGIDDNNRIVDKKPSLTSIELETINMNGQKM